jgi:hypothetical protein
MYTSPTIVGLGREERTKVGVRSATGESCTGGTTLTRLAPLADLSREERER